MDRNNGRYTTNIRRMGQQNQHQSSSLSSTTSNNNQQHMDNHRNSSSTQYSNTSSTLYTSSMSSREPLTQHDELIRYIREAWTKVNEQGMPTVYHNESDIPLKNFKPFNLEEYWGQRLVQNINVSHGHQ